jgi:hypothetical protein
MAGRGVVCDRRPAAPGPATRRAWPTRGCAVVRPRRVKALSAYLRAQVRAASDRFVEVAGQEPGAAVGEAVALRWKTAIEGLLDRVRDRSTPAAERNAQAAKSTTVGAATSGLLVDADTGVGYTLEPGLPLEAYRSILEGPKPQRGPLQWRDGEWQLIEQQRPPR